MKSSAEEVRGSLIVILVEGDTIPAQRIKATHKGFEILSGILITTVDPLNVRLILELKPKGSFAEIAESPQDSQVKEAIARTLCGVLEIEKLVDEYNEEMALRPNTLKVVIFGSASLALTVLPERVSHDVDTVGPADFVRFCESRMRKSRGATPEFSSSRLLQYLGDWEERASRLEGINGVIFHIFHPLDTLMQKLLRVDEERFSINDIPDIEKILTELNPSEETLLQLLTENPARYRIPDSKPQGQAIRRNTNWFTDRFLPAHNLDSIKEMAERLEEESLEKYGFVSIKSSRPALQKDRKLTDLLDKKDPPPAIS